MMQKPFIDRIEQGPVALFAVGKRSFGALQLAIVGGRKGLEPSILGFERCNPAMQLFDVDCHGYPPEGNRGNGGRLGNNIGTLAISSSAGTESSRFLARRPAPAKPACNALMEPGLRRTDLRQEAVDLTGEILGLRGQLLGSAKHLVGG